MMKNPGASAQSLLSSKLDMHLAAINRTELTEYRRFAAGVIFRVLGGVVAPHYWWQRGFHTRKQAPYQGFEKA